MMFNSLRTIFPICKNPLANFHHDVHHEKIYIEIGEYILNRRNFSQYIVLYHHVDLYTLCWLHRRRLYLLFYDYLQHTCAIF